MEVVGFAMGGKVGLVGDLGTAGDFGGRTVGTAVRAHSDDARDSAVFAIVLEGYLVGFFGQRCRFRGARCRVHVFQRTGGAGTGEITSGDVVIFFLAVRGSVFDTQKNVLIVRELIVEEGEILIGVVLVVGDPGVQLFLVLAGFFIGSDVDKVVHRFGEFLVVGAGAIRAGIFCDLASDVIDIIAVRACLDVRVLVLLEPLKA